MSDLLNVIAPTASSLRKRAMNGAATPAATAPRVADPVQPITPQPLVTLAQPNRANGDVVAGVNVRRDEGGWYVVCGCGWTTGYCESNAQASRVAAYHAREAHGDAR